MCPNRSQPAPGVNPGATPTHLSAPQRTEQAFPCAHARGYASLVLAGPCRPLRGWVSSPSRRRLGTPDSGMRRRGIVTAPRAARWASPVGSSDGGRSHVAEVTAVRALLITGPTGVGKSTAQEILRREHGFWVPRTCTTRPVEVHETDVVHFDESDFLAAVRGREVLLPAAFGSNWYGWFTADLQLLLTQPGRAAVNVRPYTALVLHALLPDSIAVWLTLDDDALAERRGARGQERDVDAVLRERRHAQDLEDNVYQPCFAHVIRADDSLLPALLELVA